MATPKKKRVNTTIDSELVNQARKSRICISSAAEQGIMDACQRGEIPTPIPNRTRLRDAQIALFEERFPGELIADKLALCLAATKVVRVGPNDYDTVADYAVIKDTVRLILDHKLGPPQPVPSENPRPPRDRKRDKEMVNSPEFASALQGLISVEAEVEAA
ncbi:MAG: type II toxin-antitoxin system CcdA family antitoxin [Verrucomicrobiota bacterium]